MGQFVYVIRKRIKLAPEKAIFIFVDEVLPPTAALMSAIYEEHKYVISFLPFALFNADIWYQGMRTTSCTLATRAKTRLVRTGSNYHELEHSAIIFLLLELFLWKCLSIRNEMRAMLQIPFGACSHPIYALSVVHYYIESFLE